VIFIFLYVVCTSRFVTCTNKAISQSSNNRSVVFPT